LVDIDEALRPLVVDFRVVLLDLGAEPASQISAHPMLRGGLLALKTATVRNPRRQRRVAREALALLKDDDSTFMLFLQYISGVIKASSQRMLKETVREFAAEKEEKMQTLVEYWLSQGMRKGLKKGEAKGEAKGLAKGEANGLRRALMLTLTKRFKKVPPRYLEKIAAADVETLQRYQFVAIDAATVRAVFAAH
jgi:hypothetical protein